MEYLNKFLSSLGGYGEDENQADPLVNAFAKEQRAPASVMPIVAETQQAEKPQKPGMFGMSDDQAATLISTLGPALLGAVSGDTGAAAAKSTQDTSSKLMLDDIKRNADERKLNKLYALKGQQDQARADEAYQRQKSLLKDRQDFDRTENEKKRQLDLQLKGSEKTEKRITALKDDLDPNKARGGNLAKSQAMINSADRVDGLFRQFPDYNIPAAQTSELAAAVAGLINGGSAQSQHQIDQLTPSSMKGDTNKIVAWLTNDPKGQGQQQFMKMMHETAIREREIAQNQVKAAQVARLSAHSKLAKEAPEDYKNILQAYDIDPADIKNGRYVPKPSEHSVPMSPEDRQAIEWAKSNPNDPRSAKILQAHGM